ncbi:uncharacterized protein LOC112524825 [Cynara cardunculus var. scolymus]|nr:uncharacterized protein LOC112524825 [Cynara cardunculus var. scolymus]
MTRKEAEETPDVVTCTYLINFVYAKVLFDYGASYSFISPLFVRYLYVNFVPLDYNLVHDTANNSQISITCVFDNCQIEIEDYGLPIRLFPLPMREFDVVVGMDWLAENQASIVYNKKLINIDLPGKGPIVIYGDLQDHNNSLIYIMKAIKCVQKGCQDFLAYMVDSKKKKGSSAFAGPMHIYKRGPSDLDMLTSDPTEVVFVLLNLQALFFLQIQGPSSQPSVHCRGATAASQLASTTMSSFPRRKVQIEYKLSDTGDEDKAKVDLGYKEGSDEPALFDGDVRKDHDPFSGGKVRRKASMARTCRGDYIDVRSKPYLMKILEKQGDRGVIFSDKVLKFTGLGKMKRRILLITDFAIYIVDPEARALKRRIALAAVERLCLSELSDNFFAVIVPTEYDLLMASTRKTEIVTLLVESMKTTSNYELEVHLSNSFEYNASSDLVKEIQFEEVEDGTRTRIVNK